MEILDHLVFGLEAEIQNAILGINTPAELVLARQFGYNDSTKRVNIFDGTGVNYLLQDNDISIDADFTVDTDKLTTRAAIKLYVDSIVGGVGAFRGDHDANGGATPTATQIKAGDYWRVSVGGTIAGLSPVETVNAGDLLFARSDDAATGADFFSVQGNFANASDVALNSVGSYGGIATNVQEALEELHLLADFDLNSSLEWVAAPGRILNVKLAATNSGLQLLPDGLAVDLTDFASTTLATGDEIPVLVGSGANEGKLVMDSAAISAAIGDFLPLAGTGATPETRMSGDIFFESASAIGLYSANGDINNSGSVFIFQNGKIGIESNTVAANSPWKGLYYMTGFNPNAFTAAEQTDGTRDRYVPDIAYVKTLIAGGVDFSTKAGQGIDYTGSIYNIDLDSNSGLEINGTSPDGKLRIKGLADYTAVTAGNQVALGYNSSGNLIANKADIVGDYLPLTGTAGSDLLSGTVNMANGINFSLNGSTYQSRLLFNDTTKSISLEATQAGLGYNSYVPAQIEMNGLGFVQLSANNDLTTGSKQTSMQLNKDYGFYFRVASNADGNVTFAFDMDNKGLFYGNDYSAHWNSLAVATRDRIIPDIGYVKTLLASGVDFAAKAGQGINYTGSIYNIDLDTNSGLELNGTSPDGKLRIKGLADYTAITAPNQIALGFNSAGNLIANKADIVGNYLPLTGTAGADVLSGTVKLATGLQFFLDDTTTQSKFEFRNADGFSVNSQATDTTKNAWLTLNGSAGNGMLFTSNASAQNASVTVGLNGLTLSAFEGAADATVRMDSTRNGLYYDANYHALWNALPAAQKDRVIPDIAYISSLITTGGRQSYDITGTGAIRIFDVTHTKGAFPIVQVYRVDTNALVTATITNVSATQVRVTFAANVPTGRVHKVVIV